jgi:hypothetical protein
VTEGFFFAQQTHRGEERKIRMAQAVAMPQGAARWTTRAGGGPAGGLAKDTEQCRMVELSASGSSSSIQEDEGRSFPRESSFNGPQQGLRCGASTFGQDSDGLMMGADGKVHRDAG